MNLGRQPVDNLLTADTAVILSGKTYEQVRFFGDLLNLQFMVQKTCYEIQSNLILPTINHFFEDNIGEQHEIILDKGVPVTSVGDGHCDSPGYSAKYCTYTSMEASSHAVVGILLAQVTGTTSSVAREKEGCRRSLDNLLQSGVEVAPMATDRHSEIWKKMREKYDVNHQFDMWHLTKSITKRLTTISKRKDSIELGQATSR